MNNFLSNNFSIVNLYKNKSLKSEVVTQMIYGERFSVINKSSKWLKIKLKEDNYVGYIIKKKKFLYFEPTHKVSVLFAKIYKNPNFKSMISKLPYASKIKIDRTNLKFCRFQHGWIEKKNIKPVTYKNKDIFKHIQIFKGVKYIWGGKTFKGIDCSALIQICFNFNNKFCPRDSVPQAKYFKKNINLKNIQKNDIIYWKGHVALALSRKKLIHAYGPRKKTLIMNITKTIELIKKTADLKVVTIKRI